MRHCSRLASYIIHSFVAVVGKYISYDTVSYRCAPKWQSAFLSRLVRRHCWTLHAQPVHILLTTYIHNITCAYIPIRVHIIFTKISPKFFEEVSELLSAIFLINSCNDQSMHKNLFFTSHKVFSSKKSLFRKIR